MLHRNPFQPRLDLKRSGQNLDRMPNKIHEAETGSYIPPQSPIAIQPGDKGFEIVGKAYNKWLWTFPEWKKKSSKIINPAANWGLNAKPMTAAQIKKKMKNLYLKEGFMDSNFLKGGKSDKITILDLALLHSEKKNLSISAIIDHLTHQLVDGVFIEMEHTDSPQQAREIAMDHLFEDPDYYTKLKKIEK
ncbi:hypothetical protein EBS02_00905 [bacterium]|nr:hypothetical protein [bacterium]